MTTSPSSRPGSPARGKSITYDIRGFQNNWSWTLSNNYCDCNYGADESVSSDILYRTRFLGDRIAEMYKLLGEVDEKRGEGEKGGEGGEEGKEKLIARVNWSAEGERDAEIVFISDDGEEERKVGFRNEEEVGNFTTTWPFKLTLRPLLPPTDISSPPSASPSQVRDTGTQSQTLNLIWTYTHEAIATTDLVLLDPVTKIKYGQGNDHYITIFQSLDVLGERVRDEVVVFGTAAQILLGFLMPGDMRVAMEGPEGKGDWETQRRGYWDEEHTGDSGDGEEEEEEMSRLEDMMLNRL